MLLKHSSACVEAQLCSHLQGCRASADSSRWFTCQCRSNAVIQYLQLLDCVCRDQEGTAQKHSASPEAEPHRHQFMQSSSSCAESWLQSPDLEDLR